jgi:hypothetical protein
VRRERERDRQTEGQNDRHTVRHINKMQRKWGMGLRRRARENGNEKEKEE